MLIRRFLLTLCALSMIVFVEGSITAQGDDSDIDTYILAPGVFITVPDSWDVVEQDGMLGATSGNLAIYAYAPSQFPRDTQGDTPSEILVSVFEYFNNSGYLVTDPLTLDLNGRTIAYTDYLMWRLLRGQLDQVAVRFMIVPFADGRYGALTVLVDAGDPNLFWSIFEPIIRSFGVEADRMVSEAAYLTRQPLSGGYVIGIPEDVELYRLNSGAFSFMGMYGFLHVTIYPPDWMRSFVEETDNTTPLDCDEVFLHLLPEVAPRVVGGFDSTESMTLEAVGAQHAELRDGRAIVWIDFPTNYTTLSARFVVLTVAEGECGAIGIRSVINEAITLRDYFINAMLSSFEYVVQDLDNA